MLATSVKRRNPKNLVTEMISDKAQDEERKQRNLHHHTFAKTDNLIKPGGPFVTSFGILRLLHHFSCRCIFMWYLALDYLLSRFISTTAIQQHPEIFIFLVCKILISFVFLLLLFPIAIVSVLIWFPLQLIRPRSYSYLSPDLNSGVSKKDYEQVLVSNYDSLSYNPEVSSKPEDKYGSTQYEFFLASGNVCLMPEFIGRVNNLFDTVNRAKNIASYFTNKSMSFAVPDSPKRQNLVESERFSPASEPLELRANSAVETTGEAVSVASTFASIVSKENVVSETFPESVDFICLQEVFDSRAARCILRGLKQKFPYIIYDVSWPVHSFRLTLLTSGLCIASRFPFVDAVFHAFPHGSRDDKLACKGLLMTKVFMGKTQRGINLVGFVSNTHLQAWTRQSACDARCRQLDMLDKWITEFTKTAKKYDDSSEIVLFNVIAGDFNFDKTSYFDHKEQNCSFMQNTFDPCVDDTGMLHSWVVGTELHAKHLHDKDVCTPKGLQKMLVSELERHRYVASTMPRKSSLRHTGDGKRKIDHIVYKHCDNVSMDIKDYKFFTGLATLTDHIPIGMSFSCDVKFK